MKESEAGGGEREAFADGSGVQGRLVLQQAVPWDARGEGMTSR